MLLDALLAVLIVKFLGLEGLKGLAAFCMVAVIRTCHNVNWVCGNIEQEVITMENEEEEN